MSLLQVPRGLSPGPAAAPDAVAVSITWRNAALDGTLDTRLPTLLLLLLLPLTPKLLLLPDGHIEFFSLGAAQLHSELKMPLLPQSPTCCQHQQCLQLLLTPCLLPLTHATTTANTAQISTARATPGLVACGHIHFKMPARAWG